MVKIAFLEFSGQERIIDAKVGDTLMEVATKNGVEGIDADCGGACACATCHVYIDPRYFDGLSAPDDMEEMMLEFAKKIRPNSRLGCQVKITDSFEGMCVTIPEEQ